MPLVHHELCFGCGRTNLFGLIAELEQHQPGFVSGECFIKQDHQGPTRGTAHPGVVAAALTEAMAFACGPGAELAVVELRLTGGAPVGAFLRLEARLEEASGGELRALARATAAEEQIASASALFVRGDQGG